MFKKLNLFSRTEMKLLTFMSTKDGEVFEREISRLSGVSAGSVNSILADFTKLGLVRRFKRGRMLFYSRNDENPLLRQFKVFVSINNIAPLVEKIEPFNQRILLFGSCAEGRNGEKSDVDLFVLSNEKEKIRKIAGDFENVQVIVLNSSEYAVLAKKDKPLWVRINKGIELHSAGEDDFNL